MKKKNVVILGSTGSIGQNTLDVIRRLNGNFRVFGLAANRSVELMADQIKEFKPTAVAIDETRYARELKSLLPRERAVRILNHADGLEKIVQLPQVDFVMSGVVGARGLLPLVSAIKAGKTVGLANKEALVMAGEIIMDLSKKFRAPIIPVDSEHSAIFQCLAGQNHGEIARLILTASGGPFYNSKKKLNDITVPEALHHPTWKMGNKITIDSATLMNKGLEAIEAHHLFHVPMERISIVIHPQSIVHSLVEFQDGAILAQLSHPDMRLPIQYALTYPQRFPTPIKRLDLSGVQKLEFYEPDFGRFPCLKLALEAGRKGGTSPAVLSSSNEEAVEAFLAKQISFMQIPLIVGKVLSSHPYKKYPTLSDILEQDRWVRKQTRFWINKLEKKRT